MTMLQETEAACCRGCGRPMAKPVHGVSIGANTFTVDGVTYPMSPKRCELLRVLLRCAGETVHRERLLFALYQDRCTDISSNILDVMVKAVRKILTGTRLKIITDYGVGYRLELAA